MTRGDRDTGDERPSSPGCGPSRVLPIVYGEILVDPATPEDELEYVEGGCVETVGASPQWHCKGCGHQWL